jgi:hypothetical protein
MLVISETVMFFLREYNVRQQRKKIYYGTAQKNPSAT